MTKIFKKLYLVLMLIFLYAPIVVLIVFSFNESRSYAKWTGFSLKWYKELFTDSSIMKALYYTVLIAVLSSVFATALGTVSAVGINWMGKISRKVTMNINNITVLNPDIVIGVSLMVLYVFFINLFNFGNLGFVTLLLSHIAFNVPYVILSILPKLSRLDNNLYEAALDLGAKPVYAFFNIILPEIAPGILIGFVLSFTLSIDDFVISFFTTGSGVTNLSILIYSMARRGINPKINALSTIMFLVIMALLYFINSRDDNKTLEI